MAHDAGVGEQPRDVVVSEPSHPLKLKIGESVPERGPFAEDRQPREARLKSLQAELLEQPHVV